MIKMKKTGKATILIVDDKTANIFALENLLAEKDRVFVTATNGKDALKTVLNEDIDLIILDVQMPDMDGFEVAQILKSNKKTKDIPIIFASAEKTEYKSMMKGYEEGAIDYLFKPLDPQIAKAKVAVFLKTQLQKKELIEKNSSLQKSELLINNSADIIGIIDIPTFTIEEINNAFTDILGYTLEETAGRTLTFFLTAEDKTRVQELNKQKKERLSFETRIYCKDRSTKWLHWKIVVKDEKWFVNARDITLQKKADEQIMQLNTDLKINITQLEATNKELEFFSYSVSHDLRAPLRAINEYSKIIEEDHQEMLNESIKRLLHNIQHSTQKMETLIDDLLAFSRLGKKEVEKSLINMNKMTENVLQETSKSITHHAVIKINPLHPAEGDYALLHQVWVNLISNAIKYSGKKDKPEIEIGSTETENEITYHVKDNGAGFDMKYADKLFAVFQRLHNTDDFEGTGIGLAMVQRIIIKHAGRIWVQAAINEGATFYFTLPKIK